MRDYRTLGGPLAYSTNSIRSRKMKTFVRPVMAVLFLVACAMPLFAQNPNVAIKFEATHGTGEYCAKGTFKNLTTTTITVSYVELWIYNTKTCKRVCLNR